MDSTGSEARKVTRSAVSLSATGRRFLSFTSPRLIAPVWLGMIVLRVGLGSWSQWDLVAVAVVVMAQSFLEWILHVFVLHFKPKSAFGMRIDPLVSRRHRAHHADPGDELAQFVVIPVLCFLLALSAVGPPLVSRGKPIGFTVAAAMLTMLMNYEWVHYLVHSPYVPKSRSYRYLWRAHRLHHFKNEHYWFGVSMHVGDWVLGTFPAKNAVPTSTTVRTLGVEPAVVSEAL